MAERAQDRIWSGIDIPKTLAGVLAAVSAAVVGSFLGVAGTLAGAAVASIVGSVGTEVYRKFIDRGHQRIKASFVTAPAAVGTPGVAAAAEESPSQPEPYGSARIRWRRVALAAAGLFVLAIGTLTAFEAISGKSAAQAVGGHSTSGTTLGSVFGAHKSSQDTPAPAPSSSSVAPTTGSSQAPGKGTPTTAPTGGGSTPSAAPTQTATPAPTATVTQNANLGGASQQP